MHKHIVFFAVLGFLTSFLGCSSEKSNGPIESLTYDTFIEKIWDFKSHPDEFVGRSKKPCVVVFTSAKSEPCQNLQPIIEALQDKHKGKIVFYSVDIEAEQALGNSFKIDVVPTVLFLPKEGQPTMIQGLRSQTEYEKIIEP